MKTCFSLIVVLVLTTVVSGQSGRRAREIAVPMPPPPAVPTATTSKPQENRSEVTVKSHQHYRCTDDGLEKVLDQGTEQRVFSLREVDSRVTILFGPPPSYTKEARRNGVQGFVILKALLSADAKVDRIRVMKRLPAGLTENALKAACRIRFKPAIKDGQAVAQSVTVEYVFRLAHSSIFGP